jgi:lysozyme
MYHNIKMTAEFEGFRAEPYLCPEGFLTVGYGFNLERKEWPFGVSSILAAASLRGMVAKPEADITRWGHLSLTEVEGRELMRLEFNWLEEPLAALLGGFEGHHPKVLESLFDMAYNLGIPRLAKFQRMLGALDLGLMEEAAKEALASKWARQVGRRAGHHADVFRSCSGWVSAKHRERRLSLLWDRAFPQASEAVAAWIVRG